MKRGGRRHSRAGLGQASVEFALVLPLIVVVCLAVVQVTAVARRQVLVAHAAREAARAAAVEDDPAAALGAARAAATAASSALDPARLHVALAWQGDRVVVTLRYVDPTDVAVVGRLVGPVTMHERVTMRHEGR